MQIQVETDNHIENKQDLQAHVEAVIREAIDRFSEQVTHVEVHLGDVNSGTKSGPDDMRCLLEARLAGAKPLAVSHSAPSLHQAIDGAVGKLRSALDTLAGKQIDRQRRGVGTGHVSADIVRDDDV
jgi:ribosome-associated translation inhibitor RaiA